MGRLPVFACRSIREKGFASGFGQRVSTATVRWPNRLERTAARPAAESQG